MLPLSNEFKCDNLSRSLLASFVDLSERAFTDWVQYVVLIHSSQIQI